MPSADRLALLVHLSQTFNSSLDLDEVLNRVMDEVISAVHAERGFVMLVETGEPSLPAGSERLVFKAARGMDQTTIEDPQFQISRSVVERVAREGTPVLTSDAQTDERFNIRQSVVFLKLRAILCVPISLKDRVLGVIYVDNRVQAGLFTQADIEMLSAIASSAAIAIENARLYQVAVEKGRMERELQMARKVQSSLLPQDLPQYPGWEFATRWKPAREVGGDYYDFIPMKNGKLGLVIADVTDKGMPAALFMASTRSIVRATTTHHLSPMESVAAGNRLVFAESGEGLFVTLFYGQLDPPTGELIYVNAGHNPPLLCRRNETGQEAVVQQLTFTGMPLGVDEETAYDQLTVQMEAGDFLLLYTDGVTEPENSSGEEFGMERLVDVVRYNRNATAEDILVSVVQAVEDFTGAAGLSDDITLVIVKRCNETE
jgi:serine phosphatase RsbU (regulator of sigma subunit)